jgi:hypothetical protein
MKTIKLFTESTEIYEAIEELQERIADNGIVNTFSIAILNDGEAYTYGKAEKYDCLNMLKYMYNMDITGLRIFEYDNGIISIDIVTVED